MKPSLTTVLAYPTLFDAYQRAVGADRQKRWFVEQVVAPKAGERVVDVGCGTGAIAPYVPASVKYVGIDISDAYVKAATARFGSTRHFFCADSTKAPPPGGSYDCGFVFGVLHHLDDAEASMLLNQVATVIRPGGRFIALEPVLAEDRSALESLVMDRDRGKHIRSRSAYAELVEEAFGEVEEGAIQRPLKIPYSFATFRAAVAREPHTDGTPAIRCPPRLHSWAATTERCGESSAGRR